jgi:hypothetical protein
MKANQENKSQVVEDLALFGGQFKGNAEMMGSCHKAQACKNTTQQSGGNNGNSRNIAY